MRQVGHVRRRQVITTQADKQVFLVAHVNGARVATCPYVAGFRLYSLYA